MYYQQTAALTRQAIQKLEVSLVDWRAAKDGGWKRGDCLSSAGCPSTSRQAKGVGLHDHALQVRAKRRSRRRGVGARFHRPGEREFRRPEQGSRVLRRGAHAEAKHGRSRGRGHTASTTSGWRTRAWARSRKRRLLRRRWPRFTGRPRPAERSDAPWNIGVTYSDLGTINERSSPHPSTRDSPRADQSARVKRSPQQFRHRLFEPRRVSEGARRVYRGAEHQSRVWVRRERGGESEQHRLVYATLGDPRHALTVTPRPHRYSARAATSSTGRSRSATIGVAHADLGDHHKALELHQEALALRRSAGDRDGEAATLSNIGTLFKAWDGAKALEVLHAALSIHRAAGIYG